MWFLSIWLRTLAVINDSFMRFKAYFKDIKIKTCIAVNITIHGALEKRMLMGTHCVSCYPTEVITSRNW